MLHSGFSLERREFPGPLYLVSDFQIASGPHSFKVPFGGHDVRREPPLEIEPRTLCLRSTRSATEL